MTLSELKLEIEKLTKERGKLSKAISPLQKKFSAISDKLAKLIEEKDTLELSENDSNILDFDLILEGNVSSMVKYKEQTRQLQKLCLQRSGYIIETLQTAIRISLYKGNSNHTSKVLEGLNLILPYVKEISSGGKLIDIFDHNLSEDGGWTLIVKSDNTVNLLNASRFKKSFTNLEEALKYCEKYHYYKVYEQNKENTCIY